jgi:hypothetical protein
MHWDPRFTHRHPEQRRENRWLQDRAQMKDGWFAGLGPAFGLHDNWATEAMGPLFDRSKEHLGHGDKGIVAARQTLLNAMRDLDKAPPFRLSDPEEMKQLIAQIVVAAMISPDKNRYREIFRERHLQALHKQAQTA